MKYIFLQPDLPWPEETLISSLRKQTDRLRLDTRLADSNLSQSIAQALTQDADTMIACGSEEWLGRIISTTCRQSLERQQEVPVFAHIQPPRFLPGLNRIGSYLDSSLRTALSAIAARKVVERPLYNCGNTIWFQSRLELKRKPLAVHPAKITLLTPSGSKLTIHAPVDQIIFHNEYNILDHHEQHLIVQAHRQPISSDNTQGDLMDSVRNKVESRNQEEVFRLQADRMLIEGQNSYIATGYSAELTEKIEIRKADFPIRVIVPKNDILKY